MVRLILFYRQSGYMQVVVDTTVRRTPRDVYVTFRIYEGEPVRVRRLDLEGIAGIVNERPLRRAMPLKVGDPFNRYLLQASADTIAAWLRNRGYPYAQVLRNFDAEAAELSADIRFEAVPGRRMWIGDVLVQGVQRVDTATVLHTLSVHPGEQYRRGPAVPAASGIFTVPGMFRAAVGDAPATACPPTNGDSTASVVVRVAEGPRHRIVSGAGTPRWIASGPRAGWSAFGFLGDARVLDLCPRLSKIGVGCATRCEAQTHPVLSVTRRLDLGHIELQSRD